MALFNGVNYTSGNGAESVGGKTMAGTKVVQR